MSVRKKGRALFFQMPFEKEEGKLPYSAPTERICEETELVEDAIFTMVRERWQNWAEMRLKMREDALSAVKFEEWKL